MSRFKYIALGSFAGLAFLAASHQAADAQISVNIGVAPNCPYGYYETPPYSCAPYGYYGPEWFTGGVFIGAGPWFHGPEGFHGHVDNHFHPDHGYNGPVPHPGDHVERGREHPPEHFKGNEVHDGRGHVGGGEEHRH